MDFLSKIFPYIVGGAFFIMPLIYRYFKSVKFKIILANFTVKIFGITKFGSSKSVINERSQEAIQAFEQKKLPAYVCNRINEQNQTNLLCSGNLTVSDWLLLKHYKLRSLGMVMGATHYHLAFSAQNYVNTYQTTIFYGVSQELTELKQGIRQAFDLALNRLCEEARLYGAHAVVNVKIKAKLPDSESHKVEYVFFGTAITLEGIPIPEKPILCTTSVIDFVKLMQAGSMPVGLGIGLGMYYDASNFQANYQSQSWFNQEIKGYSAAVYEARHLAFKDVHEDIKKYNGNGILASYTHFQVETLPVERSGNSERKDHLLQFICLGTVIGDTNYHQLPKFKTVLDLTY